MTQNTKLQVIGHLLITDELGNIVVDKNNAIHPENISLAIAQSLAKKSQGPIWKMAFGNGGSILSGVGTVTYLTPNTVGASASLYNQTYEKIVNDLDSNNTDTTKNKMVISHANGTVFSDIVISCTLETAEPAGQNALDNTNNINSTYVFDEIGILNYDSKLLCHVIFSPVEKSTNRSFTITYTIRIQLI